MPINILNVYGSYSDRHTFWTELENSGVLGISSLIVEGDLNLTLATREY